MKHLVKEMHDVVEQVVSIWCTSSYRDSDTTQDVDDADCEQCLQAAADYGHAAIKRLANLRYARARGVTL